MADNTDNGPIFTQPLVQQAGSGLKPNPTAYWAPSYVAVQSTPPADWCRFEWVMSRFGIGGCSGLNSDERSETPAGLQSLCEAATCQAVAVRFETQPICVEELWVLRNAKLFSCQQGDPHKAKSCCGHLDK